ncbi:hypothetical protein M3686_09690 [Micrococcus luteus]|uniref:hypothetical protein n=1 Tax=Micrococcus luteus TaxID=1270 RepID=UPI00203FA20D|nr:hypothetical protein [Micrococcus luteus]MCM3578399.1 hypothetical protein [Micrococcus luteus]
MTQTPTPRPAGASPVKVGLLVLTVCAVGGVIIGAIAGLTDGGSVENMFIGAVYAGVIGLFLPGLPAALIAALIVAARGRRRG